MGLDMYLTGQKFFWHSAKPRKEDGKPVRQIEVDLGYWRKHPDLHGYIVNTFAEGKDECQDIGLNADNLRQIIAAVQARELPKTSGFFFGESDNDSEQIAADVAVFEGALAWLTEGDPDPFDTERQFDGPGFTAVAFKPKPTTDDRQKAMRSVVYRASW